MPFKSKAQERGAFSGAFGKKMKEAAPTWASETDQKSLPEMVGSKKSKKRAMIKRMKKS